MTRTLAVDLGSAWTAAAVSDTAGTRLLTFGGRRYLPSVVALGPDGGLECGDAAVELASTASQRAERRVKRALTRSGDIRLGERTFAATDLAAVLLRRTRDQAVAESGGPPDQIVLTHPAGWLDADRTTLAKAAQAAGLPEPAFVAEPIAAARHHAVEAGGPILVYDLGADTCHIAVLEPRSGGLVVRAHDDEETGGDDLIAALYELVHRWVADRDAGLWARLRAAEAAGHPIANSLRAAITLAVVALGDAPSTTVAVPGLAEPCVITRAAYERAIEPLLDLTVARLRVVLRAADIDGDALAAVVLTGAAGRTPRVSDRLAGEFGRLPAMADEPKYAVVLGALAVPLPKPAVPGGGLRMIRPSQSIFDEPEPQTPPNRIG